MASNTPRLNLYKKDPVADANDTFNITTMLNDNWDRIDQNVTLKSDFDAHLADTTKHVTQAEKDNWNSAEQNAKNFVLQANPNLLKNSSFQFGLAGWTNTCSHFSVGQTLSLGSFVDHAASVPANEWHILESTQRIPSWNGSVYMTMSAWFYSYGQTHGNIYLELYGNGNPQILGQLRADLNKDWHRKADTFYIPPGTTEIWVKFVVGGDPQGMPQGSKAVTRIKLEYGAKATPYSEEGNFLDVVHGGMLKIAKGAYTGDGTNNRLINIGFQPCLVIIGQSNNGYHTMLTNAGLTKWGIGSNTENHLTSSGFKVHETANGEYINTSGVTFYYVAIG